MTLNSYYLGVRVLATAMVIATGLVASVIYPGFSDFLNGATAGVVIYAIWFARERS